MRFEPNSGAIWLGDRRMVLMHTVALAALRQDLISLVGRPRRILTRMGYARWEAALVASYQLLTQTESDPAGPEPQLWELRNKAFHEALIAGFDSSWRKYLLSILYRHAERYRNINWRLTAAHTSGRDVHREHEDIFGAALALEAHVRLTHDIVKRQAQLGAVAADDAWLPHHAG